MKLGTQTGSLVNHIMANRSVREIEVGKTGATLLSWTDRSPATVMEVFEKGAYTYYGIVADEFEVVEGNMFDGSAKYEYKTNPDGYKQYFRAKTDGSSGFQKVMKNEETGRWNKVGDGGLSIGERSKYYDPHF